MKRIENTLFVTTQGAYLSREGETVLVRVEKETKLQVPIHLLAGIVCFGQVSCSPFLMGLCGEKGVGISFLTENGRFLARVAGPVSGNVLLRRAQFRLSEDERFSAKLSRTMVAAKIANARTVLQRHLRDHEQAEGRPAVDASINRMGQIVYGLKEATDSDKIRGSEGEAGHVYFSVFDHLIVAQKTDFVFKERTRRPPLDNVNALLSFVYTLLAHDAVAACEAVGLDPQMGFLHRDRPGRASLALDLMEELRPFLADRLVLSLINRQQVEGKGFKKTETGAVTMDDATRKTVLKAYQERKQEPLKHPFIDDEMPAALVLHVQARLLARHLRGDLDAYPAFFWK